MQQIICLVLLVLVAISFCKEFIPSALTSMIVVIVLIFSRILTPEEALAGFSNNTVILFASVFVIAAALNKTDFVRICGRVLYNYKGSERSMILAVMIVTGCLSALFSTTGLVALMLPVVLSICRSTGYKRSHILLPMAIAGSLGGGILILGGAPNSAIYASLENLDIGLSFSFFDMPKVGLPLTVIAILYTGIIGWRFLPDRTPEDAALESPADAESLFSAPSEPKRKQYITYAITILTIAAMVFEKQIGVKLYLSALTGAILIMLFRCLTEKEAITGIKWQTLIMFAGILSLSKALTKTGTAQLIAKFVISIAGGSKNQYLITGLVFLVSMLLTQMMSNTAAISLLCPLAASIGVGLGADPRALIMAAAGGASASLCTPIATPAMAMIYDVGGYKSIDYLKYSSVICAILLVFSAFYLPTLWPLF